MDYMSAESNAGGGNPSYKGYDYQKLVTVWVALTLMLGPDPAASEIVVEPASHDDVMARLEVAPDEAESSLTVDIGDELHVQIKFKGAGHWSGKDFAAVVNDKPSEGSRGPARRARAKALLLADPRRRYVFITNTSVDGALAAGRVRIPAERPRPSFLPPNLGLDAAQKATLVGRFALIEHMTFSETRRLIDRLLTERLHVPAQNLDACVERLKRLVEDRLLELPDPLRRSDVEKIAETLGGMPHPNPQLACYVPPASRSDAEDRLTRLGAVLLIGPSGYGKSLTADSVAQDRRHADPPFKVVRETAGLNGIEEAFAAPGRVLFHLEDPWGQSGLHEKQAATWKNALARLIGQRAPDKQFVITSRTEIAREALGEAPAPVWADRTVVIDDNSYDEHARRAILRSNLASADSWRQDLARQHEERLLRQLRTPLELNAFTRELKAASAPAEADVDRLVDRALTDSRRDLVVDHVRGFGDRGVRGAAILWATLRFSRALGADRLRVLRRRIEKERGPEIALDDLADHLSQTQLQRDSEGTITAHGKVAEALESVARTHPRAAEAALNAAARAACALARSNQEWMDELLRLVDGARALADKGVDLDDQVVDAVDALLTDALSSSAGTPRRFRRAWQEARQRLSDRTALGRLVRWLDRGAPVARAGFDFGWRPPKVTAADRARVLAEDPDLRILRAFVAHVLPSTHENYDADDLIPWLEAFGQDLTPAFLSAGDEVVRATQFVMSADTISEGALAWPGRSYERVWDQILRLEEAVDAALAETREQRRQAWQGELDFAEQLAVDERAQDQGPSTDHFAKGYVRGRRRQEGYGWIPQHPRPDLILPLWAEVMRYDSAGPLAGELDAFFAAAGGDDSLQAQGLRVISDRRIDAGRERVMETLRTGGPEALDAAVHALGWLQRGPEERRGDDAIDALLKILQDLPVARAAMLAPHIVDLKLGEEKAALASRVVKASAPAAKPAVHLALARSLRADDAELLEQFRALGPPEAMALIADGPRKLSRLLLVAAAAEGLDMIPLAREWLASGDASDGQAAVAALAHSRQPAGATIIMTALEHADFQVRRTAVRTLAPVADDAQRRHILTMAADPSAPVRAAVAEVIGEQGWRDGLDTLLKLLRDTRNYARHPEAQRRDEPEYHVARAAADALARFGTLSARAVDEIIDVLRTDRAPCVDVELHARLLGLLCAQDDPEIWNLFGRALTDDHVVGEADENLYPIRYAAAWNLAWRIGKRPAEADLAPWHAIAAAAGHIDPQLAAPALVAVGSHLADRPDAATLQALRGTHASDARIALALAMLDDRADAADLALRHGLLPEGHPLFDDGADISTDEAGPGRWPISAAGRDWLVSLGPDRDVSSVLLWVMAQRTGLPIASADFDPSALRRRAKIPLTTMAEMFGME